MKMTKYILTSFFTLLITAIAIPAFAEGKFSGLMFGDYYWFAKHNDTASKLANGEYGIKGHNGFWMRRIYLTYDHKFDGDWSARFRLEANSSDFKTAAPSVITPFVKDAFLQWKWNTRNLFFGLSGAPTFDLFENHWGLRAVEKTPEDLWNFGSARDFGVAAKGSYGDGLISYHLMFGNGSSNKHETNNGKKGYLSLSSNPIKEVLLELYGDYESFTHNVVTHIFAGYKIETFRLGGLYSYAKQSNAAKNITSLYGVYNFTDTFAVFGRMDKVSAGLGDATYLHQSSASPPTLIIAGADFELEKNIHLIPNIESVTYKEGVDSDLIPRLTFSWVF
ncbi:MAG: hypothetical protein AABZ06_01965 [Bdellovibrionota bacterium]